MGARCGAAPLALLVLLIGTAAAEPLAGCLERAHVPVLLSEDGQAYDLARRTFNAFHEEWPAAIVYPNSTAQVAAAIKCARAAGLQLTVRAGGHGNEGESVASGAVTLDMRNMRGVRLAPDMATVRVQGGATIGQLIAALWQQSNGTRGFPGGTRPSVGVAGFVLGGGFGGWSRWAGLGADQLVALTGVDARGRVLTASAETRAELLWAARGGGGGRFLAVTEFQLRTMDVAMGVTNFNLTLPRDKALAGAEFWQAWASGLSPRFTPRIGLAREPDGSKALYVGGRYVGFLEEAKALLQQAGIGSRPELLSLDAFSFRHSSYLDEVARGISGPVPAGAELLSVMSDRAHYAVEFAHSYKFRSLVLDQPLPAEGLRIALEFAALPGAEVEWQWLGGNIAAVPQDASAVSHLRNGSFVFVLRGTKAARPGLPAAEAAAELNAGAHNASAAMRRLAGLVPQYKAYINFRDTDAAAWSDYRTAFWGPNVRPLECLKARYDPAGAFTLPFDLAPVGGPECDALLAAKGRAAAAYARRLLAAGTPARR